MPWPGESYCGSQGETTTNNLLFVAELVANPPNGKDHLRILRILLDFGSETIDMGVDRPIVAFVRVVPDLFKQILSWKYPSRVRGEEPKKIKLFRSEFNLPVSDSDFTFSRIDPQSTTDDRSFVLNSIR